MPPQISSVIEFTKWTDGWPDGIYRIEGVLDRDGFNVRCRVRPIISPDRLERDSCQKFLL